MKKHKFIHINQNCTLKYIGNDIKIEKYNFVPTSELKLSLFVSVWILGLQILGSALCYNEYLMCKKISIIIF